MELDINRSIIYDTIKYFDFYYNFTQIKQKVAAYDLSTYLCFKFYNLIKEKVPLSPVFTAFFDYNNNQLSISVLSKLFLDYIKNIKEINDFNNMILNKELMLKVMSNFYCNKKSGTKDNKISETDIFSLEDIDENTKISLGMIAINYDYIANELIKNINTVYSLVREIFSQNTKIINKFKSNNTGVNDLKNVYKNCFGDTTVYYISLMAPYSYKYTCNYGDYVWILGYLFHDCFIKENALINVNNSSIANVFANQLMVDVLNIIREYQKINPAEILKILPYEISPSTLYRIVSNLEAEKAIYVSAEKGKKLFYSINNSYFQKAAIVMNETIMYYCNKK